MDVVLCPALTFVEISIESSEKERRERTQHEYATTS
jgi:hypothetical protein